MLSDESEVSAMEKQTLIAHCLTYPNAVEDYHFADNDLTIMRHPSGGKWFACIMHLQGKLCINLKCDPVRSEFLRRTYKGVYPAWQQRTLEHRRSKQCTQRRIICHDRPQL